MIDHKYQTLIKEIRDISSDIARLDQDLTRDRQDVADIKVNMANLSEEVNQLRREMAAITSDVGDKVKDTLKPAVKEVHSLKDAIQKKRQVIIKGVSFYSWVKSKFKGGEIRNE